MLCIYNQLIIELIIGNNSIIENKRSKEMLVARTLYHKIIMSKELYVTRSGDIFLIHLIRIHVVLILIEKGIQAFAITPIIF